MVTTGMTVAEQRFMEIVSASAKRIADELAKANELRAQQIAATNANTAAIQKLADALTDGGDVVEALKWLRG